MSLHLLRKHDIVKSRVIPFHGIEIYEGPGADDLHFYASSISEGSTWKLEEYVIRDDRGGWRTVMFVLNAIGYITYNNWGDVDYEKQFELMSFRTPATVLIHLAGIPSQRGRGDMSIQRPSGASVAHYSLQWRIDAGSKRMPSLIVEIGGRFSVDAIKGYEGSTSGKHFFAQGWEND